MTMTVKVQRPIIGNDWLIYDKNQKHVEQVPAGAIPKHVRDAMFGDLKAYFTGSWSSVVGWGMSQRVKDEDW